MAAPLHIEAVSKDNVLAAHPLALSSVFWELADPTLKCEPAFEKEAWLHAALMDYGECGFHLKTPVETLATVLFCHASMCPGAAQLPSGPPADGFVITSLFAQPRIQDIAPALLLDAAIMAIMRRGEDHVEAFGWREDFMEDPENPQPEVLEILDHSPRIGLMNANALEAAGFEVVHPHPALPRYRLELPPKRELLVAYEVSCLTSSSNL